MTLPWINAQIDNAWQMHTTAITQIRRLPDSRISWEGSAVYHITQGASHAEDRRGAVGERGGIDDVVGTEHYHSGREPGWRGERRALRESLSQMSAIRHDRLIIRLQLRQPCIDVCQQFLLTLATEHALTK